MINHFKQSTSNYTRGGGISFYLMNHIIKRNNLPSREIAKLNSNLESNAVHTEIQFNVQLFLDFLLYA